MALEGAPALRILLKPSYEVLLRKMLQQSSRGLLVTIEGTDCVSKSLASFYTFIVRQRFCQILIIAESTDFLIKIWSKHILIELI